LHQVGDLFELNVKLRCQTVNYITQFEVQLKTVLCSRLPPWRPSTKHPIYVYFIWLQRHL